MTAVTPAAATATTTTAPITAPATTTGMQSIDMPVYSFLISRRSLQRIRASPTASKPAEMLHQPWDCNWEAHHTHSVVPTPLKVVTRTALGLMLDKLTTEPEEPRRKCRRHSPDKNIDRRITTVLLVCNSVGEHHVLNCVSVRVSAAYHPCYPCEPAQDSLTHSSNLINLSFH